MRIFKLIFLIIFQISPAHASLFGPKDYESCVLENIKNAKTDDAVNAVVAMCRSKFQEKESSKKEGLRICYLYHDGWEFKVGNKSNDKQNFITFGLNNRMDVEFVRVSIPRPSKSNSKEESKIEKDGLEFVKKNLESILRACQ